MATSTAPAPGSFDDLGESHAPSALVTPTVGAGLTPPNPMPPQRTDPSLEAQQRAAANAAATTAPAQAPVEPAKGLPKLVTIVLEEGDHIPPGGQPVGINGTIYLVKPGIPQQVPEGVLNVLNDAIMEKPIMSQDGTHSLGNRRMNRFPYRIHT